MKYIALKKESIKNHSGINEKWLEDTISANLSILGLGNDLRLKDVQRRQSSKGILDLLLENEDQTDRYTVEIQLGSTDESHLVRTIEYWDIERRRYPMYNHTAVIIAEDITSRFLNVISLFNGNIPLVAIQVTAVKQGDGLGLIFTKILDAQSLGLEDDGGGEVTDRKYWEKQTSKENLTIADKVEKLVKEIDESWELSYTKSYIGFKTSSRPDLFVLMRGRQSFLRLDIRLPETEENDLLIEESGLASQGYDKRWGRYKLQLQKGDIETYKSKLIELLKIAMKNN